MSDADVSDAERREMAEGLFEQKRSESFMALLPHAAAAASKGRLTLHGARRRHRDDG